MSSFTSNHFFTRAFIARRLAHCVRTTYPRFDRGYWNNYDSYSFGFGTPFRSSTPLAPTSCSPATSASGSLNVSSPWNRLLNNQSSDLKRMGIFKTPRPHQTNDTKNLCNNLPSSLLSTLKMIAVTVDYTIPSPRHALSASPIRL